MGTFCLFALGVLIPACHHEDAVDASAPDLTTPAVGHASSTPTIAAAAVSEADRTEAKQIFETRCANCHGKNGAGNGPLSASIQPKPRNFMDPAFQHSVTDDQIEKAIVQGGTAVGRSGAMPPNQDLEDKPGVVKALVEMVRQLGGK